MLSHLLKIYWDLYLKVDIIDKIYPLNSYISTNIQFQVSKLSNIIVYPHLKFTLPSHNAPNPLPIFQLNLQPPKFIRQDFITIPTPSCIHPFARTAKQSSRLRKERKKETLQTFAPILPISVWQTNSRQKLEENDSLRKRTKMIDRHDIEPVTPPSRPSSTLIVAQSRFPFEISTSTMWIRVLLFFYSNSNVTDRLE